LPEVFPESLKKASDNRSFLILHHLEGDCVHGNRRRSHREERETAHNPEDRENAAVEHLSKKAVQFIVGIKQLVHLMFLLKIL
jgi:hypothetical protein